MDRFSYLKVVWPLGWNGLFVHFRSEEAFGMRGYVSSRYQNQSSSLKWIIKFCNGLDKTIHIIVIGFVAKEKTSLSIDTGRRPVVASLPSFLMACPISKSQEYLLHVVIRAACIDGWGPMLIVTPLCFGLVVTSTLWFCHLIAERSSMQVRTESFCLHLWFFGLQWRLVPPIFTTATRCISAWDFTHYVLQL